MILWGTRLSKRTWKVGKASETEYVVCERCYIPSPTVVSTCIFMAVVGFVGTRGGVLRK
jgi:hypothetical protein